MNMWGVLVACAGFLLLYMGIKNVSPSQFETLFKPQSSSTSTTTQPPKQTTPGPAQ